MPDQTLVAYQHNGWSTKYTGTPEFIGSVRDLLIPNLQIKGIVIYEGEPLVKVEALNYTQLKKLRK